jgi:hypothetical protein
VLRLREKIEDLDKALEFLLRDSLRDQFSVKVVLIIKLIYFVFRVQNCVLILIPVHSSHLRE